MVLGRVWRNVEREKAEKIKVYLLNKGGVEKKVSNQYEAWRVSFLGSTFTYYKKFTLYSTPSNSKNPVIFEAYEYIDSLVSANYIGQKDFLIGADETGKGEIIGPVVLVGVIFPKEIFNDIYSLVGAADTKKKRKFEYWDEIFKKLNYFRSQGLSFICKKISPWQVDRYNLNKLMDVAYQRILSILLREIDLVSRCRVVLDDYGIGPKLLEFLNFLQDNKAQVIVAKHADDKYIEVKTAALISKRLREAIIKTINEDPNFQIDGLSIGSGNVEDKKTYQWLYHWYYKKKYWPSFIKKSFKTISQIELLTDLSPSS